MGRRIRGNDYRAARVGAAAALTGVVIVLLIVDAVSRDYELQIFTLAALLTSILTLLGLEVRDQFRSFLAASPPEELVNRLRFAEAEEEEAGDDTDDDAAAAG